jgi:hypothetical protein
MRFEFNSRHTTRSKGDTSLVPTFKSPTNSIAKLVLHYFVYLIGAQTMFFFSLLSVAIDMSMPFTGYDNGNAAAFNVSSFLTGTYASSCAAEMYCPCPSPANRRSPPQSSSKQEDELGDTTEPDVGSQDVTTSLRRRPGRSRSRHR